MCLLAECVWQYIHNIFHIFVQSCQSSCIPLTKFFRGVANEIMHIFFSLLCLDVFKFFVLILLWNLYLDIAWE